MLDHFLQQLTTYALAAQRVIYFGVANNDQVRAGYGKFHLGTWVA